ncbi:MAG: hypothetical protein RJA45_579 [Actinomycetota bacterium]|jgi:deoxyribodipyrimidine photo-lyase
MNTSIFWFRKDLRLADHQALTLALESSETVYCIATADQIGSKFDELSDIRKNSLRSSWNHLSNSLDGRISILKSPAEIPDLAFKTGVQRVYVSNVFDTNGMAELRAITKDLKAKGIELVASGSNYAIEPGTVTKPDGTPYRVYTPFYKTWVQLDRRRAIGVPELSKIGQSLATATTWDPGLELGSAVRAGEAAAMETLEQFLANRVENYAENRNRADLGGTSHLSHALSHGEIHPRTILERVPEGPDAEVFVKEIAWREFYADVLYQKPDSLTEYLDPKFAKMRYDEPDEKFEAWKLGQTGFPMVDAGMRQLLTTGWMHNRVRMIVASFLVKDLHLEWQLGAEWFEQHLSDFDPASNAHGWQWTAGCGTDASPYYRIFNPITQGYKFDPDGNYVRKFIPELRHLSGSAALEPWEHEHGYSLHYQKRIVDHAVERNESLARLEELKTL